MMKELLAATTTTLVMQTATAQVPASITLYGLMDAGMGYTRLSGAYKDPATGRTLPVSKSRLGALSGGHPDRAGACAARKTWATACMPCSSWNRALTAATAGACKEAACSAARPPSAC